MGRTRSQAQHSQEQMLGADVTAPGKLSLLLGEHERAHGVFAQLLERVLVHGVDSLRLAAGDEHLFVELEAIKLEAWGMFSTCLLRRRGTGFAPPSWSQPRSRIAAGGGVAPEITAAIRTGDTPSDVRRSMERHPPDILITTPESLYLILTSAARRILASVRWLIVDEIHSVAATKRGSHLALSLERLAV